MKYYVIAGEASGDLHGSNLIKALKQEDPEGQFRVWGGDLMEEAGGELVKHYRDLAFMGFVEVAKNLRTILGNIAFCKEDIQTYEPDALVLIDYPGFNLRIAKWAHQQGLRVLYYISPQVWAWHKSRVKQIRAFVERMYVILPFEPTFFAENQVDVDFVGHPLLDVIPQYQAAEDFHQKNGLTNQPLIALLPGSRKQEIKRMLAEMLQVIDHFPEYQFVIGGAPSMQEDFYHEIIGSKSDQVKLVQNQTYDLLSNATAALVTSGTATLETALFEVPEVVCYKGNALSYWIARRLVDVPFISLVNLIVERELVRELIQYELNGDQLVKELEKILSAEGKTQIQTGYRELKERLGESGASRRTAELMVNRLKSNG